MTRTIALGLVLFCLMINAALAAPATAPATPFLAIAPVTSPKGLTGWLVEDHTQPIIAVSFGFVGAGAAQDAPDRQGLARMLASTLDEGAGPDDSRAFQEKLADNAIQLSFDTGRDHLTGSLKTLSETKDIAFALTAQALTAPRFDIDAVARMSAAHQARLRGSLVDGEWIAARLLNDRAYDGHPYALNTGGTLTSLAAITADDLRAAHQARLARDNLRVAVVGDMTPIEMGAMLDHVFGGLPAQAKLNPVPDLESPLHLGTVFVQTYDAPQTQIMMLARGPRRDAPDYAATVLMNHIFGGGGFGSRLTDTIREQGGLTYGISSGLSRMAHVATLGISTSTQNQTVPRVMDMIRDDIARLRDQGVTATELSEAKSYLLGAMPAALTSTDRIAGLMLSLMLEGRPIDDLDQYRRAIARVDPKAVQQAAQNWLHSDQFVTIMVGKPGEIPGSVPIPDLPNTR